MKENSPDAHFRGQGSPKTISADWLRAACSVLALVVFLCVSMGCATPDFSDLVIGSNYVPQNVHRSQPRLASNIRRLAVLPMTSTQTTAQYGAGLELLSPILLDEMSKTRKFEVISVSSERLRHWTGRSSWNAEENLPPDLLQVLRTELACDAILFSRLSLFHPYPPLAVGWNLKLVDANDTNLLWAADEVVDASDQSVASGARRYQKAREHHSAHVADSRSILLSPKRFGQYAASAILTSLPTR